MNSISNSEHLDNSKLITDNHIFNNNSYEKESINQGKLNEKIMKIEQNEKNENRIIIRKEKIDKIQNSFFSSYEEFKEELNVIDGNQNIKEDIQENEAKKLNNKKNIYNILVAVRCRPLNKKEKEISKKETMIIINEKLLKLKDPNGFLNPNNIREKEKILEFDYVFGPLTTQEKIFNLTTKILIDNVVNGYNSTVFAYGATGAGKTFTMLGCEDNPGLMPLALKELFKTIQIYKNREYIIKLWYIEIYNENIRDLLVNNKKNNEYLELRESPDKGIIINNVTEIITNSSKDILNILKKGNKNRTTEETDSNESSSRSHAILQINVSYKEKNNNDLINNQVKYGKLNLIDLAGSERASVSKNKGMRLFEGANINRSLLALGNCINALYDKSKKQKKVYVPYRDSKLTRLLKDSLGGNSRTVMIANVSSFIYSFDDTYNTLKYAERSRCLKTKVSINNYEKNHYNDYINLIKNLQNKINILENKLYSDSNNRKKRIRSISPKNFYSENLKLDNYNNISDNNKDNIDLNKNTIEQSTNNKKIKYNFKKKNNNYKISENNKEEYMEEKNKEENDLIEKEKKIALIIEDYIQQTEAEIQLKQKIINIQYNIILLFNKIQENKFNKKNNSEDKIKLRNLKNILDKNKELLNEISKRNEQFIKKYIENDDDINNNDNEKIELNYLQKNYIYLIYKNTKIQKDNIEIKLKYTLIKNDNEKNINYIKELENQLKIKNLIIKELLYLDNIFSNNIKIENYNQLNDDKTILNTIKKEKNINNKILTQLKNKRIYNKIENKRKNFSEINRPCSTSKNIKLSKAVNPSKNKFFNLINTDNNLEEDYIIDFDRDDSTIANSYLRLKIPTLIKSNSSLNIHNFDTNINILKKTKENRLKKYSENNNSFSNEDIKKNSIVNQINYKSVDFEVDEKIKNSNNKIQSMLKEIKNLNTEISSKFYKIEQQSIRDDLGVSTQIQNSSQLSKKKIRKININITNKKENNILKYINTNENDINKNSSNKNVNNYSVNCRIINNDILNKKNLGNKRLNSQNLLKSENNKNNNIRRLIPKEKQIETVLAEILLSQGKFKNKQNKIINKEKIWKIKEYPLNKNLQLNKSSIIQNKNEINGNKKFTSERNKSLINNNKCNNKEIENNNCVCLNRNNSMNKAINPKNKVIFLDDISISQLYLKRSKKRLNIKSLKNSSIRSNNNTMYTGISNDKSNKYSFVNSNKNSKNKSFNFKKRIKEKNQIIEL